MPKRVSVLDVLDANTAIKAGCVTKNGMATMVILRRILRECAVTGLCCQNLLPLLGMIEREMDSVGQRRCIFTKAPLIFTKAPVMGAVAGRLAHIAGTR